MKTLFTLGALPFLLTGFLSVSSFDLPVEYSPHLPTEHFSELPNFLHPCHKRHKRFNLCVKTTLQNLFAALRSGSKELDTPPIEPLQVPFMQIIEGSGDVIMRLNFSQVSIFGLGNTKVVSVRSDLENSKLEMTLKHPYLNIVGQYFGDGSVNTFPIVGSGDFSFNMTDVAAAWIIYFAESGTTNLHLTIDNFLIDIIPVEIVAQFGHAIDDDDRLGSALNGFFNENSQEIFKITKPKITEALSTVFTNFANEILRKYPASSLLPS